MAGRGYEPPMTLMAEPIETVNELVDGHPVRFERYGESYWRASVVLGGEQWEGVCSLDFARQIMRERIAYPTIRCATEHNPHGD